jgi:hypothetical protein
MMLSSLEVIPKLRIGVQEYAWVYDSQTLVACEERKGRAIMYGTGSVQLLIEVEFEE